MRQTLMLLAAVLLLGASTARAFSASCASDTQCTFTYTEPTTNEDGSPVTDLAATQVWGDLHNTGPVLLHEEPATAPAGGGTVEVTVTLPEAPTRKDVPFFAVALDAAGLRSWLSNLPVVRNLAPGPPQ